MKVTDGLSSKRAHGGNITHFWRIGKDKSKEFSSRRECAEDYITKYIERNPKYKELVYDKSWDEIFAMFSIKF